MRERGDAVRRAARAAAVMMTAALLPVLAACTSGGSSPAQTPGTAAPTTSATATPTPRPGELAVEAATTAYRNAFHVMNQGSIPPKTVMEKYMTGDYLNFEAALIGQGYTFEGQGYLDGVTSSGTTGPAGRPTGVKLIGCENWTQAELFQHGKPVKPGSGVTEMYLQHITATRGTDGVWRVATLETDQLNRTAYSQADCVGVGGGGRTTRASRGRWP